MTNEEKEGEVKSPKIKKKQRAGQKEEDSHLGFCNQPLRVFNMVSFILCLCFICNSRLDLAASPGAFLRIWCELLTPYLVTTNFLICDNA
jgi:hypothetical protein